MKKRGNKGVIATVIVALAFLVFLGWYLAHIFEGEKPVVNLEPLPEYLSGDKTFVINASDAKRGIKRILVTVTQDDRTFKVIERDFPFIGLANRQGTRETDVSFRINPRAMHLAEGLMDLKVSVWDYSRRKGGDGNMAVASHRMIVDTTPPSIRAVSRLHYINEGGTGLVVYRTSPDTAESGVYVGDIFSLGHPAGDEYEPGHMVCYFAVPVGSERGTNIYLWAIDKAGNSAESTFNHAIRGRKFPVKTLNISDRFIERILPDFTFMDMSGAETLKDKFLKINRDQRLLDDRKLFEMRGETAGERLWDGTFIRMRNAATMAGFGDKRIYNYQGKEIDRQTHLGIDLASLANSEIQAANSGRVVFTGRLGIYGLTVVIDHGQGISTLYSHLSDIETSVGDHVDRGEIIGFSGQTGLAGGDHLHFSILVNGVFVNPIEFWDANWIRDNITKKLDVIVKSSES